jgi:hypothetical protein
MHIIKKFRVVAYIFIGLAIGLITLVTFFGYINNIFNDPLICLIVIAGISIIMGSGFYYYGAAQTIKALELNGSVLKFEKDTK